MNSQLDVDGTAIIRDSLNVQQNVDFDGDLNVDGLILHLMNWLLMNYQDLIDSVFIGKDVIITGFTTGTISTSISATEASRAGFATFSDFAGIVTFANIAGVATISGFSTNSHRAGFATFSDLAGIHQQQDLQVTLSGLALTAGLSTNTNFIDVDSTDANSSHPITFIDSSATNTFHKLKIDASEWINIQSI